MSPNVAVPVVGGERGCRLSATSALSGYPRSGHLPAGELTYCNKRRDSRGNNVNIIHSIIDQRSQHR